MEPVISSINIKRFRSIPGQVIQLSNPTFLVGWNGSGKSNFVDAFAFLSEAMELPLHAIIDKRGGISVLQNRTPDSIPNKNVGLGVELRGIVGSEVETEITTAHYAFELRPIGVQEFEVVREQCVISLKNGRTLWFDREQQVFHSNLEWLTAFRGRWLSGTALAMPFVGTLAPFSAVQQALKAMRVYSIEPEQLRRLQDPDSGARLNTNGSNAASVLEELKRQAPDDLNRIGEILMTVTPNIRRVQTTRHGRQLSLEFTQEWGEKSHLEFEAFNMSDGTLRVLGLLLAIFQRPTPSLIVIEEPEASIHPGALGSIIDLLRGASQRMQVLVTTHSPEVLDASWLLDENLRVATWEDGATTISDLSDASRTAIRRHLMGAGQLLKANALDPNLPLFAPLRALELFRPVG
jgi:predicted ATPase